jgi:hypothetical protein
LDVGKDLNQRVWYTGSGPLEVMTLLDGYWLKIKLKFLFWEGGFPNKKSLMNIAAIQGMPWMQTQNKNSSAFFEASVLTKKIMEGEIWKKW